jgi:hypothetical protein
MTTTTNSNDIITIALSDSPPVRIAREAWPVIASVHWHDGKVEAQANRTQYIKVRQHDDGRAIVYAADERGPGGMPAGFRDRYAGFIVPAGPDSMGAIIRTIRRVAGAIDLSPDLANDCIQDLPPVALD